MTTAQSQHRPYKAPAHAAGGRPAGVLLIACGALAGEIVAELDHDSETYAGDTRWYDDFSAENRILAGGEHSWDILSDNSLDIAGGLYPYTVKNLDDGSVQRGKFVIIK